MKWFKKAEEGTSSFLIDHPLLRQWSIWSLKFFLEVLSAFIFAYGFRAFISPSLNCVREWTGNPDINVVNSLISGGASGISQTIIKFLEMFPGVNMASFETTMISILYFVVNIPLFFVSFFKISKQFACFTLINVLFVSLFNQVLPDSWIYDVVNLYEDHLARAIFGGITTGVSSGLAMMVGTSSGGVDIVSMYISEKKSTGAGHYSTMINSCTVICYVVFSAIGLTTNPMTESTGTSAMDEIVTMALYTIVYFFVSGTVVDILNTKNKKQELQIITTNPTLPTILVRAFPHAASVVDSRGAYSGKQNLMIYMVISRSEQKKALQIIKTYDKLAFVTIIDINQVRGNFYVDPIE